MSPSSPAAPPHGGPPLLLTLSGVQLLRAGRLVLQGIDLSLRAGQWISLIGPPGAGKSSLLQCVQGLLRPQQGQIRLGHTAIERLHRSSELAALRRRVGYVGAGQALFAHLNLLDNLTLGPRHLLGRSRAEAEQQARHWLERVGLAGQAQAWPAALDAEQGQRAALARALSMRPELLLLDEVENGLPPEAAGRLRALLRDLAATPRPGALLVTRSLRLAAELSDTVLLLEAGKVLEQGPPARLFGHPQQERTRAYLRQALGSAAAEQAYGEDNKVVPLPLDRVHFAI